MFCLRKTTGDRAPSIFTIGEKMLSGIASHGLSYRRENMGSELEEERKKKKTQQKNPKNKTAGIVQTREEAKQGMNCQRKWNFHPWSYSGREEGPLYYRSFGGMNVIPPQCMGTGSMTPAKFLPVSNSIIIDPGGQGLSQRRESVFNGLARAPSPTVLCH